MYIALVEAISRTNLDNIVEFYDQVDFDTFEELGKFIDSLKAHKLLVNEIKIPYGSRGGVNRCDLLCAAAPEEAAQKYGVPLEKIKKKNERRRIKSNAL
jgi:hypothetical protein